MELSNLFFGLLMVIVCFYYYVCVFFEDYIVVIVEVENWDGWEFGGRVVWLGYYCWVYEVN